MWAQLQDQIRIRTKRLASAAEIHRFNRDLNELISRIQEKDASLSMEDLGRDIASVQGLQRKHEGHERDLMVVKQQVETLSVESGKLQTAYQGKNKHKPVLRTVPTIVIAHTFCASPDTRISYRRCLLIQGYFCAV